MHTLIALRRDGIGADEALGFVQSAECGATSVFLGSVRPDHLESGRVVALEYEAYADVAETKIGEIVDEVAVKFGAERVAVLHRTGRLEPGETAVVVAIATPHRAEAFSACRYVIDELKRRVPIWKKEWTQDGGQWVTCSHDAG